METQDSIENLSLKVLNISLTATKSEQPTITEW